VARTVRWTEAATRDLEEAARFISRDSPFYAAALVREARAAARSLKTFADRGRIVPESHSSKIRELFIKSYRIIYKIDAETITVVAFVHGARDLQRIWDRRQSP
jgi:toxin ParE1/3/4